MASPRPDIFHLLYDRTPVWLAHLRTISNKEAQREAAASKDSSSPWLATPDLYNLNDSNFSASVFSLLDSTPPGLTSSQSTKPYSHKTASLRKPQPPASVSHPGGPQRVSQHAASPIFYDGAAQALLSGIIDDIAQAVAMANRSPRREELKDISQRLIKAADACHDAAFQLLREGTCEAHSSSTCTTFQDLFVTSCVELKHEREGHAARPPETVEAATSSNDPPLPSKQNHIHISAVQIADLSDPIPYDDDGDGDDDDDDDGSLGHFSIGAIRLTSRTR